jgi:hypothetical protein
MFADYGDEEFVFSLPGYPSVTKTGAELSAADASVDFVSSSTNTISVTPSALDFGSLQSPYTQPVVKTVTVKNTDTVSITLNQPASTDYIIGALSDATLDPGENATFTVQPKDGLAVGSHDTTISVSGSGGVSAAVAVSFAVTAAQVTPPAPVDPPKEDDSRPRPSYDDSDDDDYVYQPSATQRTPAPTHTLKKGDGYYDTMRGKAVELRLYADWAVPGYTTGTAAEKIRKLFEKWFSNQIRAIHFDQDGKWEKPVKIAAKIDLAGIDTTKMVFYYYDPKKNSFRKLEAPAYWIDANGYLRFTTEYAGEIVISEDALVKRWN